jgi:hypothetical protein
MRHFVRSRQLTTFVITLIAGLVLSSCRTNVPIEPTLALLPTETRTPEPTGPVITVPPAPSATLPPTWTPIPSATKPTDVPITVIPTIDVQAQTAQAPIKSYDNGTGGKILTITEAQLNAILATEYNIAPLQRYIAAPQIELSDETLILTAPIIPQNAAANSNALTVSLIGSFAIFDGNIEFDPVDLSPSDAGVTTMQVKQAHNLLVNSLKSYVAKLMQGNVTYNSVNIRIGSLILNVNPPQQ